MDKVLLFDYIWPRELPANFGAQKPFCAIRSMFSVVWRAALRCSILFFPRRPPFIEHVCKVCLYEHFCACQLYIKKPSENPNTDHLNHLYGAILCDSYYVFRGFARGVSVFNFVVSEATSEWSEMSFFQNC